MRKLLPPLLLSLAVSGATVADTSPSVYFGHFDAQSRQARIERGRAIVAEVRRFADLVRSPSPSEEEWVKGEQIAIEKLTDRDAEFNRTIQLVESPDFQQVKMRNYVVALGDSLGCISDPKVDLKREMLCWAAASYQLSDSVTLDDGVRILLHAKRLPDKTIEELAGTREHDGMSFKYRMLSRNIQENVVLPYLRGEIK